MRIYLILLIPFLFLNCSDSKKKTNIPIAKKDSELINQVEVSTTEEQNIVKKSNKSLPVSNKTQTEYPDWLNIINREINEELGQYGKSKINKYTKLNDSISYAIFEFNDGVCSKHSMDTYLNEKEVDHIEISVGCDHDLSVPEYEWKEYEMITPKTIKLKEYREYAHDSLIDSNGYMKDEYDFLEVETKIDSVINLFEIQANGEINKQNKN
ncbi:hypothetical protein [Aquimarina algiphila]|uniref:hypothetical protein n=1 Tax=Aquimarina algiphila TaxID=2047982 RepID=UPI00232A8040|nr:hypothetical protein [Aquimarina algiphila]